MKFLKPGLLLIFAGFLYYLVSLDGEKPQVGVEETFQANEMAGKRETVSDERPPVSITVTPLELSPEVKEWKFKVVLDTHSGNLDQDLQKSVSLADDGGNISQPLAWEGAAPGGHHRVGTIVFAAIEPSPDRVELLFRNIGDIPERSFKWEMK